MNVRFGDIVVRLPQGEIRKGQETVDGLTELEAALLAYLVERPGKEVSRDELHREVWGYAEGVRSRAVDFTMSRLRRKVEPDPTAPRFLHTARGAGYRYEPAVEDRPSRRPMPPPDTFVGRTAEVERLSGMLEAGARLVTLLGLGGVGKTRLALEFLAHHYEGDAAVADLGSVTTRAGVIEAVANALGMPPGGADPEGAIGEVLRNRGPLVVLDDVEHLIGDVSDVVRGWLDEGHTRVLVTSRERLRVAGEHVLDIRPLDATDAAAMFRARAEAVRGPLGRAEADTFRAIAERLDGWPLAIELAAARTRVVSPDALLTRLDPLRLSARRRDLPERHRSVRTVLEDSWGQLEPEERETLVAVAAVPHGASLEALEALLPDRDAIDAVADLADRALVRIDETSGAARARVVNIVRKWVLANAETSADLVQRRLVWAADEAERVALHLRRGQAWQPELDLEQATVRAIWDVRGPPNPEGVRLGVNLVWWRASRATWLDLDALAAGVVADAEALADPALLDQARLARAHAAKILGRVEEAIALGTPLLADPPTTWVSREAAHIVGTSHARLRDRDTAQRLLESLVPAGDLYSARALSGLVVLHASRAELETAIDRAREAERTYAACRAEAYEALAAISLASVLRAAGHLDEARGVLVRGERAQPKSGRASLHTSLLHERYAVETYAGHLDSGESYALAELEVRREQGDRLGAAWALGNLGVIAIERGDFELARTRLTQSLDGHRAIGSRSGIVASEANLGILTLLEGDRSTASLHLTFAVSEAQDAGIARFLPVLKAFLAIAEDEWDGAPSDGPPQDMRLLATAAARYGVADAEGS
jgi:predicted ATPase/DNA-binding winged helix-turn-helix (wHTH) protein